MQLANTPPTRRVPSAPHNGFTLIELLVVISILGILAVMAAIAVRPMLSESQDEKTRTIINRLDEQLRQRAESFERWFSEQESRIVNVDVNQTQLAKLAGKNTPANAALRKVIAKKMAMKIYFPQRPSEVSGFGSDNPSDRTQSAEVLYYMLTELPIPGYAAVDLGDYEDWMVGDTDGDGRREFLDGFGNPLRFYRWPTRLIQPNGAAGSVVSKDRSTAELVIYTLPKQNPSAAATQDPLNQDPDDTTLVLINYNASTFEQNFHTRNTWHTLLLVSAGADNRLGLYEPTDKTNYGYLARLGLGPDGKPGQAGVDDDGNSTTDDAGEIGWPGSDEYNALTDNITNRNLKVD